jgi:hypothetical protein
MAINPKRSFTSFVKRPFDPSIDARPAQEQSRPNLVAASEATPPIERLQEDEAASSVPAPPASCQIRERSAGKGKGASDRTRVVTSTGRVRTYTASRNLPGVTLRLTEDRWERLKMLSVQERRPIQEILGEALDGYMRGRGLKW